MHICRKPTFMLSEQTHEFAGIGVAFWTCRCFHVVFAAVACTDYLSSLACPENANSGMHEHTAINEFAYSIRTEFFKSLQTAPDFSRYPPGEVVRRPGFGNSVFNKKPLLTLLDSRISKRKFIRCHTECL